MCASATYINDVLNIEAVNVIIKKETPVSTVIQHMENPKYLILIALPECHRKHRARGGLKGDMVL